MKRQQRMVRRGMSHGTHNVVRCARTWNSRRAKPATGTVEDSSVKSVSLARGAVMFHAGSSIIVWMKLRLCSLVFLANVDAFDRTSGSVGTPPTPRMLRNETGSRSPIGTLASGFSSMNSKSMDVRCRNASVTMDVMRFCDRMSVVRAARDASKSSLSMCVRRLFISWNVVSPGAWNGARDSSRLDDMFSRVVRAKSPVGKARRPCL